MAIPDWAYAKEDSTFGNAAGGGLRGYVKGECGAIWLHKTAGSSHGPWRIANSPAMKYAFPSAYFAALGLPQLLPLFSSI